MTDVKNVNVKIQIRFIQEMKIQALINNRTFQAEMDAILTKHFNELESRKTDDKKD